MPKLDFRVDLLPSRPQTCPIKKGHRRFDLCFEISDLRIFEKFRGCTLSKNNRFKAATVFAYDEETYKGPQIVDRSP